MHARPRKTPFTLIELLVVVAIIGIMLGIVVASPRLLYGAGVDAASRSLSAAASLARQYAISQRCRVALLMPQAGQGPDNALNCRFSTFTYCKVDSAGAYLSGIPNTKVEYLPTGSVINPVTDSSTVTNVKWADLGFAGSAVGDCAAIVFKPNGALAPDTADPTIRVFEGANNGGSLVPRNQLNQKIMTVNRYSGKASFQ